VVVVTSPTGGCAESPQEDKRRQAIIVATAAGRYFIDPISNFGASLTLTGAYDPRMRSTLSHFLSPGGVFVDIGANEGYFSVVGPKLVSPAGRVVAVEPQARIQEVRNENCALNQIANVEIVRVAISDTNGSRQFALSPDMNTGSKRLHQSTKYKLSTENVRAVTLSGLFSEAQIGH